MIFSLRETALFRRLSLDPILWLEYSLTPQKVEIITEVDVVTVMLMS